MDPVLQLRNICKSFPGVKALDDVSIDAGEGEVLVLQGENGAGKSTLLKILMGLYQADAGEILFNGSPVSFKSTLEASRAGFEMVFQELTLLPDLTVAQNVFLNYEDMVPGAVSKSGIIHDSVLNKRFWDVAQKYNLHIDPREAVGNLSITEQQMVEIIKAVVKNPKVLILDEPTSALTKVEVDILYDIVMQLKAEKKVIIFISHRMDDVFRFGDRIAVMKDGTHVATVDRDETSEREIIRLMVGREIKEIFPKKRLQSDAEAAFEVKHLNINKTVKDISFSVGTGEILGIASLQGQGQTTLLRALAGVIRHHSGAIRLHGRDLKITGVRNAIRSGIIYIPEDRKVQGAFQTLSIKENIAASSLWMRSRFGFVRRGQERELVRDSIRRFGIKTPSPEQYVGNLSGGNQQKVVLGRACAINPKVLLFNEPTRGIDVDSKQEIYTLMREYAERGVVVIIYSSDMLEVIGLCDKVITMYEGRITDVFEGDSMTEENILLGITGCEKEQI